MYELFSGYPSGPIQKWYIWTSFQTSRKRFPKLQEAVWLTVINEILKVPPHFDLFFQVNCFYKLSSGYPKDPTQKRYIWASFQTSRKRFHKLQKAIWLTVINEIFKFPLLLGSFCQISYLFELFSSYLSYPIKDWYIWASFQTSWKKFCKLLKAIWPTVINEIFILPLRLGPFCQTNYLFELSLDCLSYPIQKGYIWASFQTTRKKFRKFFKFSP